MEVNVYDVTPPPVQKVMSYDIDELTQEEADALVTILGYIGGRGRLRDIADDLYHKLRVAGASTDAFQRQIKASMQAQPAVEEVR